MKYEVLELEVTRFENADVVTASGTTTTTGGQAGRATLTGQQSATDNY